MAPDQNTTTTLDMLLQQGLEITPEGRCTRHPDVIMLSKDNGGGIISCQSCALEQKKQEEDISEGGGVSLYSKMVSSLHDNNDNLSSSYYSRPSNNYGGPGTNQMNGINSNRGTENNHPMDDGLETLIARWCQLQDVSATTKPSSDMLSTTLILLQLQKLERRVFHQETCIQNLQANIQEQQSDIQSDLTQILTFIATAANSSSSSRPSNVFQSYRQKNPHYQQDGAVSPASAPDTHPVNPQRRPSQRSLYQKHRDPKLHPSSHFTSVRTIERQPPKPPKRHDSFHSLAASLAAAGVSTGDASVDNNSISNTNTNPTGTNTINEDANRANKMSALPGRPQPIMVSSLSDSTLSTSNSSRSFNVNHWGVNTTIPSAGGAASTGTNGTANTATTATGGAPRPSLLNAKHPLKPKNSFRNPTGPQLEIIWDASEHTQGQAAAAAAAAAVAAAANGDTTQGSRTEVPGNPKDIFTGKGALPKLTTCLDDGEDDDDESSKYKAPADLFSGMKTYMSKAAAAATGPNNHDSCFTSAFQSFAGDATSTEDGNTTHDDDTDSEDDEDMTVSTRESNISTRSSNISSTRDDNILSTGAKESKKEKKRRKKEQKREKKEKKREKKEKKKQEKLEKKLSSESIPKNDSLNSTGTRGSTSLKNNKVSPDDQPFDENPSRKSRISKSIFWKRSGKKKQKSRESSPNMPRHRSNYERETEEFCVVNDNPRTHSLPTADAKTDIQVEPVDVNVISDIPRMSPIEITPALGDNSAREGDDLTVKTPLTAQTPQAPNERRAENFEPPPPPQAQHNRMQQQWHHQRRAARATNVTRAGLRGGNGFHPPSPPPRRRGPFPRTRAIMPTLVNSNSKREIVIGTGESSRMQISTLTLDTALPSADAGSVLHEVTNQPLKDKINERGTYTGTINELEEPDGYGTMIYNSGAFYKGEWKEGHWHGEGILRTPSGDSYEGEFVYDCRHGRGIYKYENGDVYEGDFSSDKRHGKGTFLFQNGSMYRGDFAYGNFHGYGWYEFEEGYYEGSWAEGNYEGIGTLTYRDGSHYTGRFKGGVADGLGEELKPDGTTRRGMWKNGEFLGQQDDEFTGQQQQDEPNVNVVDV